MYGSSWMLLRGFGAMNGLRGGAGPPSTGFGTAEPPSNGATADASSGFCGMGTTGAPAVCAPATPAHADQAASVSVATRTPAPQPLCRIARRAYGRLLLDGAEAARAHPRSKLPHQPLHAGVSGR